MTDTFTAPFSRSGASYSATVVLVPISGRPAQVPVVVVEDLGRPGRLSVRAVIQGVLDELREFYGELYGTGLPSHVVCRTGEGDFSGVAHNGGCFRGFYPIGAADVEGAARMALRTREPGADRHDGAKRSALCLAENHFEAQTQGGAASAGT